MGVMKVQVNLDRDSLLPADVVVNTLYFKSTTVASVDAEEAEAVAADVQTAYTGLDGYWASTLAGTGVISVYDMADPEPRVPVFEAPLTITPSSTALPAEVALCLSFQANPESGLPQARRRGRIYLGPLVTAISAVPSGSADSRPNSATRDDWIAFGQDIAVIASSTPVVWRHSVFSARSVGGPVTIEGATVFVDQYWVDDSFDTQRRRGARPTTRTTGVVVLP